MPLTNLFRGETAAEAACLKQLLNSNKARHLCLDLHCVVYICNTLATANPGQSRLVKTFCIVFFNTWVLRFTDYLVICKINNNPTTSFSSLSPGSVGNPYTKIYERAGERIKDSNYINKNWIIFNKILFIPSHKHVFFCLCGVTDRVVPIWC